MTKKKLAKLRRELNQLRSAKYNIKHSDLTGFARKVGRKPDTSRGKEPQYVSILFPDLRPISIPGHTFVNPHTANAILDDFERMDLFKLEAWLEQQEEKEKNDKHKGIPPETVRQSSDSSESKQLPRGDS